MAVIKKASLRCFIINDINIFLLPFVTPAIVPGSAFFM